MAENGRFIFQKIELVKPYIKTPYTPINRVVAQKSVFVRHPAGFIQPNKDDVINIPAALKKAMREHLERSHGIVTETVYNDTHGFIRHQNLLMKLHIENHIGLTFEQQGDSDNGKSKLRERIMKQLLNILAELLIWTPLLLCPTSIAVMFIGKMGEFDLAIDDYTKAIRLTSPALLRLTTDAAGCIRLKVKLTRQ